MASMELVELVPTAKVARELATQVAQCIIVREGSTPECRQRVQAFYDQCKAHVRHNDSPGFVSTVLSSAGVDLMACPKRRVLEDIFSVLVSLLNSASATHDVEPTLAQLRSVVTSDTTDKKESRLLILGTCFNMFSKASTRYSVFVDLVKYAAASGQVALVKPYFRDVEGWLKTWGSSLDEKRTLYSLIAQVLSDDDDVAGAQVYRIKFLDTYEDAPTGELAAPEVLAAAVSAIVGYVKAPAADAVGKKHLVDMAAVKQLRDHAEHSRLFSLLNIFATQKLEAYVAYRAANAEYMASLGIDHESSLETIRLFSLCSLAAESTDGSISYAEIAATLQVSEDEAEEWVLTAVRAGLLSGRMDQLKSTMHVSGYKRRVFDRAAWEEVQTKLHKWHDSVSDLLATLRSRPTVSDALPPSKSVLRS